MSILGIIGGFVIALTAIALLRVIMYEKKINKLHATEQLEIEQEKKRCTSVGIINGRIERVKEKYQVQIDELERKRRFLLDKLPFLRK